MTRGKRRRKIPEDSCASNLWPIFSELRGRYPKHASTGGLRPKTCKLIRNRTLAQVVAVKLTKQWSPEQIEGWLKHVYAVNKDYQVSHETIYRSLYVQARAAP